MELITLYAAVAIFATSGVAKLLAPRALEPLMREIHLGRHANYLAVMLGCAEIALAALLAAGIEPFAAASAEAMLLVFTFALLVAIRSGGSPSCGCLGDLSDAPVGISQVVRNLLIGVLIGVGAFSPTVNSVAAVPGALALAALVVLGPEFVTLVRDLHMQARHEVAQTRLRI